MKIISVALYRFTGLNTGEVVTKFSESGYAEGG
jgi:hypothetical protein